MLIGYAQGVQRFQTQMYTTGIFTGAKQAG